MQFILYLKNVRMYYFLQTIEVKPLVSANAYGKMAMYQDCAYV